jgi:regulation of enolase protein 1 (concanavalin A-like superfamily)
VDLVLAGHSHSYERSRFIRNHYNFSNTYDSSYMEVKAGSGQGAGAYEKGQTGPMPRAGAVYFAAGSSGKIKGSVTFETNPHPAMWTSMVELGSVVLDIDGQQLDAKFLDDAGVIRDSFTLLKGTGIAPPPPIPGDNGVIVDNSQTASVTLTPSNGWQSASTTVGYVGGNYIHDNASGKGSKSVKFTPDLPVAGSYEVFARWTAEQNRSLSVPFTIVHASGSASAPPQNQQARGGMWTSLGIFNFNAGTAGSVTVSNTGTATGSYVVADAVSFVPQATTNLPSGWTSADIGSVGVAGSATHTAGTYVVKGSGSNIGGTVDSFHFVSKTVSGDCTMTARVVEQDATHGYARAGVMIRDGTGANAMLADSIITPSNGHFMQSRVTTGGTVSSGAGGTASAPYWVRVKRVGNEFTGYKSVDGVDFFQVSTTKVIAMPASVKFGLAVCSFNNAVLGTVKFDNVTFNPPQ